MDEPEKTVGGGGRLMDGDEAAADATTTTVVVLSLPVPLPRLLLSRLRRASRPGTTGAPSAEDRTPRGSEERLATQRIFLRPRSSASTIGRWLRHSSARSTAAPSAPSAPSRPATHCPILAGRHCQQRADCSEGSGGAFEGRKAACRRRTIERSSSSEGFEALKERLWPLRGYVAAGGSPRRRRRLERNLDRDARCSAWWPAPPSSSAPILSSRRKRRRCWCHCGQRRLQSSRRRRRERCRGAYASNTSQKTIQSLTDLWMSSPRCARK